MYNFRYVSKDQVAPVKEKLISLIKEVQNLVRDNRINYVCPGDYRENSRVEKIVKLILDHMAATHKVKVTEEKIINEYKSSMKDNN